MVPQGKDTGYGSMDRTSDGDPEQPRPMSSPWTLFFSVMNSRQTIGLAKRSGSEQVVALRWHGPMKRCMSQKQNGVDSSTPDLAYSPE